MEKNYAKGNDTHYVQFHTCGHNSLNGHTDRDEMIKCKMCARLQIE